jgi:uncharacterized protein YecE (DUF72 family)
MNRPIIGTSGYSYEDWRGVFYPQELPKGKMLDFYCKFFNAVEINSTYYRIPHAAVFYQMQKKTPEDFEFIVKVNQETTHIRKKNQIAMKQLIESVQPLVDSKKFSGFLAQFPYSFKNTPQNREYLWETRQLAGNHPLFVEFRNWTWDQPEIIKFLGQHHLFYVNVDLPKLKGLLPPHDLITGESGYIRFHGRNSFNWWKGTNQTRYNYLYSESELDEWLIKIARLLKTAFKTYIFFNNHPQGKAIQNASMLNQILDRFFENQENSSQQNCTY